MPRPGPRPYECVRRAWHSDRHQPVRGSLIKEIFRVANETHSSSTKQNKEWQEKLPIVVLKAEEIMYSKANSEAEYMDLKTLWDRTNDAINTIIRRDEGSETGDFLQPCIEAALNLGCTPRRASRSQRNCHPRCYLSPNTPEVSPSMVVENNSAHGTSFVRPSNHLSSDPRSLVPHNNISTVVKFENVPPLNYERLLAMSNYAPTNSFSAYPLYYPQFEQVQPGCLLPPKPAYDVLKPAKGAPVPNLPCHEDASKKNMEFEPTVRELAEKTCKIGCDLSLRLGPLSVALPSVENKQAHQDVKDVSSQEGGKFGNELPVLDNGFPSFPRGNAYEALGSYTNIEATTRKRKAVLDLPVMEDQQFCLQQNFHLATRFVG